MPLFADLKRSQREARLMVRASLQATHLKLNRSGYMNFGKKGGGGGGRGGQIIRYV